jgi:hypothetical protein
MTTATVTPQAPLPVSTEPSRWRARVEMALLYVASILGALALSGVMVAVTGNSWQKVFGALLDGAILAPGRWGATLTVAMPMLLVALGTVWRFARAVQHRPEGQPPIGAMFMALVATRSRRPRRPVAAGLVMGAAGRRVCRHRGGVRFQRGSRGHFDSAARLRGLQLTGYAVTTDWFLVTPIPIVPSGRSRALRFPKTPICLTSRCSATASLGVVLRSCWP